MCFLWGPVFLRLSEIGRPEITVLSSDDIRLSIVSVARLGQHGAMLGIMYCKF